MSACNGADDCACGNCALRRAARDFEAGALDVRTPAGMFLAPQPTPPISITASYGIGMVDESVGLRFVTDAMPPPERPVACGICGFFVEEEQGAKHWNGISCHGERELQEHRSAHAFMALWRRQTGRVIYAIRRGGQHHVRQRGDSLALEPRWELLTLTLRGAMDPPRFRILRRVEGDREDVIASLPTAELMQSAIEAIGTNTRPPSKRQVRT